MPAERRGACAIRAGDVVSNGEVQQNWGLHLIDANVAMGDLVEVVGRQARAYIAKK